MLSSKTLPFSTVSRYTGYAATTAHFFIYDPTSGTTAPWDPKDTTDKSQTMLVRCRESFALFWERVNNTPSLNTWDNAMKAPADISSWIGYWSPSLDIEALAARWDDMEAKLSIPEAERTVFHRAKGQPTVVIIKLAAFWMLTDTHRSFATLFLRMLVDYWGGSFDGSVAKYPLASYIPLAIAHWMSGCTKPTYSQLKITDGGGGSPGVVNRFKMATTPEKLATLLVKP